MSAGEERKDADDLGPIVIGPAAPARPEKAPGGTQAALDRLRRREAELERLFRITERINFGVSLDQTLDFVYDELHEVIPYNRIGFSLIDERDGTVVARWARSDRDMKLAGGYAAPLEGSTLRDVLDTARPRIINDLEDYLRNKPSSDSTRLIVEEGMRSSLTCPLIVRGKPVGFMFFSSVEAGTYSGVHVDFFRQIAAQLSAMVEKGRLYTELADRERIIARQNELMTRDLEMARQVQRALMPASSYHEAGLDVAFEYEPATQIGGDVLDIIPVGERRLLLFVADAMGHGVPAALMVSAVKTSLQSAVGADSAPPAVLANLNRALANLLSFQFVTAACCRVDRESYEAEIALAGHAPPYWFHAASLDVTQPGSGGIPLGVDRASEYDCETVRLAAGDALVFFTDGITEAMDPDGRQYGMKRLAEQVRRGGALRVARLLDAIRADLKCHAAGREHNDDLTLLVVKAGG